MELFLSGYGLCSIHKICMYSNLLRGDRQFNYIQTNELVIMCLRHLHTMFHTYIDSMNNDLYIFRS